MNIGEKLKELRIQRNLTQEELADRCELSKGFISQVERDLASPSIATLTDMLECLGSSLKEFFSDDSAEKVVYAPQDMFEKEEEDKKITWLVPHKFSQELPTDVDYKVMLTFLDFYEVLMGFVLYRLYASLGLKYPPTIDAAKDEQGSWMYSVKTEEEKKEIGGDVGAA